VTDKRAAFVVPVPTDWSLAQGKPFRHETFSCCNDMQYFLMGCCCPQTRAADTFATVGVPSFWGLVGVLVVLVFLQGVAQFALQEVLPGAAQLVATYLIQGLAALMLAGKRKDFRAKLGGEPSLFMDFVCYWWCGCCTIIQDARQLDGAQNVTVACCCNLINLGGPAGQVGQVVGAPVVMGTVVGSVVGPPAGMVVGNSAGQVLGPPAGAQPTAPVMAKVVGPSEQNPDLVRS